VDLFKSNLHNIGVLIVGLGVAFLGMDPPARVMGPEILQSAGVD
jgi:hypothetical protein